MTRFLQISTVLYALVVISAGMWRDMATGDSPQAIWFALAVGGIAILGALLLRLPNVKWLGLGAIMLSLSIEVAWFGRRLLTHETDGRSLRVFLVLFACALLSAVLMMSLKCSRTEDGTR